MCFLSKSKPAVLSGLAATLLFPALSPGAVDVLIQPSEDGLKTYFTVSWDSLEGAVDFGTDTQMLGDPVDHTATMESVVVWMLWSDFGDYKSQASNEVFLGAGSPGYASTPAGYGVYVDNDFEDAPGDDFGIISNGAAIPSSGSFVAETTTWQGGFTAMWKPGTHAGPSGSRIVVTTAAYIPEPGAALLLGMATAGGALVRRRRPGLAGQ